MDSILAFDRKHIWHPYTSIENPLPVYCVESASGVRLRLTDGRELIDGMSSWWAVIHGYNHPVLTSVIKEQADTLSHVMFGGITHKPAVELAKLLVECTPRKLSRVFFCDSGSVAVEVGMKMAMQYFFAKGEESKKKFLTIRSGYHGDTFHAMAVCDPQTGMHQIYSGVLPKYYFAPRPEVGFYEDWRENDILQFKGLIETHHEELCAVILEPIVQGAGGMRFYHPQYLRRVRQLCDDYNVLLIADEIATGFGRSGELFACDYAEITPDIMCLGKALTGGYLTLAAVLTTTKIGKQLSSGDPGVFMHGPTFMANPLACSVGAASVGLLLQSDWRRTIDDIELTLSQGLSPCKEMSHVEDVRVLGAIGVVELKNPVNMAEIQKAFVDMGVWVRPYGKLIYLMPPYCISSEDLSYLAKVVVEVVAKEGRK